ncbi:MAG TPA: ATP-binding SpoIIE family protein phosphatase, partial [Vicinamibacterales bacterium]|nr:ATP-binding SpoIIE family protein phosphatase [Vicinamibacterales bacterium]
MTPHTPFAVVDRSQVSEVRQSARAAAERAGFSETDAHRAGLVATELATNLIKHAGPGGQVLLRSSNGPTPEVELIAVDRGPGMPNVAQSMADGFSTAGSPGTGLGAIRRMADLFDIYSQPGKGTVILTRIRPGGSAGAGRPPGFEVGGVSVAMPGETVCGDAWGAVDDRGRTVIGVVDGLGHGRLAAEAAVTAVRAMTGAALASSIEALTAMHAAARHTRGAAGTVASIDPRATIVTVAGVGNVA